MRARNVPFGNRLLPHSSHFYLSLSPSDTIVLKGAETTKRFVLHQTKYFKHFLRFWGKSETIPSSQISISSDVGLSADSSFLTSSLLHLSKAVKWGNSDDGGLYACGRAQILCWDKEDSAFEGRSWANVGACAVSGVGSAAIVCTRNGLGGQVRQGNCRPCNFHWGGRSSKNGEEDD